VKATNGGALNLTQTWLSRKRGPLHFGMLKARGLVSFLSLSSKAHTGALIGRDVTVARLLLLLYYSPA